MLNPRAVKAFLSRPLDEWEWLKEIPNDVLIKQLRAIDPIPPIDGLMKQQLIGMLIGIACRQFCFFYGPGAGKTLLVLRLLEYFQKLGEFKKGVVFVPSIEAVYSWMDQIEEWKSPLQGVPLADGSSADKAIEWQSQEDGLLIVPYPSFSYMASVEKTFVNRKGKEETSRVPVPKKIAMLFQDVDAAILDESHEVGQWDSLQSRCCTLAAKSTPIRYALAGRPFGRDPQIQWTQQMIVDGGASLGQTLGMLRSAFFEGKKRFFGGPYSLDYTLRKDRRKDFARCANHRSLVYKTEECVDLPELLQIPRRIPFLPETLEYYERVKEHMLSHRTDRMAVNNDFLRMRQLGSGFLGIDNDEFGAKAKVTFDQNPKLDVMMELIDQFPEDTKIIIPHEFILSGEMICARLRKKKIKHTWMWGGAKDRQKVKSDFQNDPTMRVLVMQWMIGGVVLNLQMATVMIVVESPVSAIFRDQLIRRFWRTGQKKRCLLYDLLMIGGIEGRILDFHREGNNIFQALTRDPARALAGA